MRIGALVTAAAVLFTAATALAEPRAVVLVEGDSWAGGRGRVLEALSIYLREFSPTFPAGGANEVTAEVTERADFLVSLAPEGMTVRLEILDLRGADRRRHTSTVEIPGGVSDPARHLALLVRAELAAAARVVPKPPPPPAPHVAAVIVAVPPVQEGGELALGAGGSAAASGDGTLALGLTLLVGGRLGHWFGGAAAEVARTQPRTIALGQSETVSFAGVLDVRPGRLIDRERWLLFWGGQLGVRGARTWLTGAVSGARQRLADTYAPLVRGGIWSWHRLGKRLVLTWDASVELLPIAVTVDAGPERAYATGHLQPRLTLGLLVDL